MIDTRQTTSSSKQNEDLYEVFYVDKRRASSWNRPADYYIVAAFHIRGKHFLSKTRHKQQSQLGIVVKHEWVRKVLENIDWNVYSQPSIHGFNFSISQIHHAFNEAVSK